MSDAPQFGRTTDDYLAYRPKFSPQLYDRLRQFGIGLPGQVVLDVAAGTGLFGKPLLEAGCQVMALDHSPALIRHSAGTRLVAKAESLPFGDSVFDVVTAAQCWHWFDRSRVPSEILRVLKRGALLVVVYQTYIPLPGSIPEKTERLILKHQPNWRHANSTGINGQVLRDLQVSGFRRIESFTFDVEIEFSRETWAGFVRTTSAVGASMNADLLVAFETEHAALLHAVRDRFLVPHRIFAVVTRSPMGL